MDRMKKRFLLSILAVMLAAVNFLVLAGLAGGVAVSGVYTKEKPLEAYPGEIVDFSLILQNMVGENDVKFNASILRGFEVVSFVDENTEYLVPLGSNNIPVRLKAVIPEDAAVGTEYDVKVEFEPVLIETEEGGGTGAVVVIGLSRSFKIKVVSEEEKEPKEQIVPKARIFWVVLAVAVVAVVIAYFAFKSRKK